MNHFGPTEICAKLWIPSYGGKLQASGVLVSLIYIYMYIYIHQMPEHELKRRRKEGEGVGITHWKDMASWHI